MPSAGPVALAGVAVMVVVALVLAVPSASNLLLPAWARALPWISPEIAAPQLALANGQVRLAAGLGREVLVGHQLLSPDPRHRVTASVPLGPAVLLPALLLAAGVVASVLCRRPGPAAWALALAFMALLVETPVLLAAAVHDELLNLLSPADTSPLVAGARWWNHGGRWWLAVAGVVALAWPLLGAARGRPQRAVAPRA